MAQVVEPLSPTGETPSVQSWLWLALGECPVVRRVSFSSFSSPSTSLVRLSNMQLVN